MEDMKYDKFIEKYHRSPNAINNQILEEGIRSVAPSNELMGSAREEVPEETFKGMSNVINFSHESVIIKSDTLNKVVMYRDIARYPEVSNVIDQIVNDCIIYDQFGEAVYLNIDRTDFSESIKKKIISEFEYVKKLLNASKDLPIHFRDWYIDSKLFFENVFDDEGNGIVEMRKLDPVSVVPKILDITNLDDEGNKIFVGSKVVFEYSNSMSYMTDQQGLNMGGNGMYGATSRKTLEVNQVSYAHSGIKDCRGFIKGHLHQAVKPAHTLKMIEDALIIYRLTRSPDRKIFYIDTGDLSPAKAEELMRNIMARNNKKMSFDTNTGKLTTDNGSPLMVDDYYLQRSNGHTVTDVDTLAGASGMNELDDLKWHNKKLYESLKVPLSRMPNENAFMVMGDDGGTTRDEINFQKFITSLRKSFSEIFLSPLKYNLIHKKIITEEDWDNNIEKIFVSFVESEYFKEKSKLDLMRERANIAETYMPWVGKIVSFNFIAKKIFLMSDEEIDEEKKMMKIEREDELLYPEEDEEDFEERSSTTINYRSNAKTKDPETETDNIVTINKEE